MSSKNAASLAKNLNVNTLQKGGPFPSPTAIGMMDGYPVAAAWTKFGQQNAVAILLRFKTGSLKTDAASAGEQIASSSEVLAALSKPKLSTAERRSIRFDEDSLRIDLPWSFRAASPDTVAAVIRALHGILSKISSPVGTACESCNGSSGELYCVDGIPRSICPGCRERDGAEGRRQAEIYAGQPANLPMGTLAGITACITMAILWGGVAYAIERIFLYGAILMGLAIAWSVNRGMGKVNLYGRVLAISLTLCSVLLGDYLFILLSTAQEWGESISLEMARLVAAEFPALEFAGGSTGWISLIFGAAGAGYVLWKNRPPALERQMIPVTPSAS